MKRFYFVTLTRLLTGVLIREIVRKDWGIIQVREHLQKSTEYRYTTIPKMIKLAGLPGSARPGT